tara:strand:+ start:166 stop:702 length:537 start_codon:yes stop_codon:yes gene_type:complete
MKTYSICIVFTLLLLCIGTVTIAQELIPFPVEEEPEDVIRTSELEKTGRKILVTKQEEIQKYEEFEKVGCLCKDGSLSKAKANGACSGHKGVAYWIYLHTDSTENTAAAFWLVKKTPRTANDTFLSDINNTGNVKIPEKSDPEDINKLLITYLLIVLALLLTVLLITILIKFVKNNFI